MPDLHAQLPGNVARRAWPPIQLACAAKVEQLCDLAGAGHPDGLALHQGHQPQLGQGLQHLGGGGGKRQGMHPGVCGGGRGIAAYGQAKAGEA